MDMCVTSMLVRVAGALAAATLMLAASGAHAQPIAAGRAALHMAGEVILGGASFYDTPGEETASGEQYDPTLFTAAAQLEIRDKFGGIKFGRLYQPIYAIAEYAGKRAILKFNDVGPLRPGRKFDLSRAAMEHFGGLERGVLADFKVMLLPPGEEYTPGPLPDVAWTPIEANGEPLAPALDQQTTIAAIAAAATDGTGTGHAAIDDGDHEATGSVRSCMIGTKMAALQIDTAGLKPELTIGDVTLGGLVAFARRPTPLSRVVSLNN